MPRKRLIGPYSRAPALAALDGRSREGRMFRAARADLLKHVGANPSATVLALIDRAAWLSLHVAMMDAKVITGGTIPNERDSRQYLAWSNSLTRALRDLGLKGNAGPAAPTLQQHLAERARAAA